MVNEKKETVFVKSILPKELQEGQILWLDEVETMQPEVGMILQQVLEPGGHLLLTDTEVDVAPNKAFRLGSSF